MCGSSTTYFSDSFRHLILLSMNDIHMRGLFMGHQKDVILLIVSVL